MVNAFLSLWQTLYGTLNAVVHESLDKCPCQMPMTFSLSWYTKDSSCQITNNVSLFSDLFTVLSCFHSGSRHNWGFFLTSTQGACVLDYADYTLMKATKSEAASLSNIPSIWLKSITSWFPSYLWRSCSHHITWSPQCSIAFFCSWVSVWRGTVVKLAHLTSIMRPLLLIIVRDCLRGHYFSLIIQV